MCAKINIKRDGYTGGFIMKDIKIIDMRVQPGDSAFLIDDSETAILYDSGFGFTGFALAEKLKNYLGRRPLNYIFLTHSHYRSTLWAARMFLYLIRRQRSQPACMRQAAACKRKGQAVHEAIRQQCGERTGNRGL